jgi:hypothetical protein
MVRIITLGIFLLAIIFFLLPWMSVSCAGEDLVRVSGLDMVTGSYDVPGNEDFAGTSGETEPLTIWALGVAAVGLIFSLFTSNFSRVLRALSGLAGIGLLIGLQLKISNDFGAGLPAEASGLVQVNYLYGYWLTIVAFALAAIMSAVKPKFGLKIVKVPEVPPPAEKPPAAGSTG